ncbi:MAG: hypothetical protein HYU66_23845, partial [Armatimonadetes bacterium]|nr:hypothetical protein [Armatimonadota bacterium]
VTATLALPPPANLPDFDWVAIAPLGGFVVVDYASTETARFRGVDVYDRALNFVWQRPLGAGHSALGLDAAGNEVLVMAVYDPDRNVNDIKSYRLSDGSETTLLTTSELFDMHFSCRASDRRGWCLVSTFDFQGRLTDSAATWLPYEDEVFALNLDGSGTTRRLCHHHSRRYSPATPDSDTSCYFSEPHATASRTGTRVLFGSNWRDQVADCMSVDAYVVEWPAAGR